MRREGWDPGALEMFLEDWWETDIVAACGSRMTIAELAKFSKAPVRRTITAVRHLRREGVLRWEKDHSGRSYVYAPETPLKRCKPA